MKNRRYKKQKPKINVVAGKITMVSETMSTFPITVTGKNRSGKRAVRMIELEKQKV